ncbi:MAG: hypothetical protein KAS32_17185 [Candidatus Peribacteraceae bacterium]|nr:hypothetical protein [Candidatus Peribacteraceae bacterium]
MANYTPSNLVKGQALFLDNYKKGEWRLPDTAVLASMFIGQKANPALAALRKREDRAVDAYLPIRRSKGSATTRIYNHTGTRGDSAQTSLSWDSLTETFSVSIKQNDNNLMSFEENYASQLQSCIMNLLERHETAKLTQLIADRTQINKGRIQGAWNSIDYVMEINASVEEKFFQNIRTSMKNNLFRNNLIVIADSLAYMNADFAAAQGQANATNLGFQFNGLNIAMTTNDIDTDYNGAAIAFNTETVGIVPWIPVQNRKALNPKDAMSYNGDWGQITVPVLDDKGNVVYTLDFAIHSYAQRADTSSSNGSEQDILLEVEVSIDIAYLSAPLSAFRATGDFAGKTDTMVFQFGQKAA